jgi:hypothetical protein
MNLKRAMTVKSLFLCLAISSLFTNPLTGSYLSCGHRTQFGPLR